MKVTLATRGGLAATVNDRRQPATVDSGTLPADEVAILTRLVAAAAQGPARADTELGLARDAMSYTITVEDGAESMKLTQSDTTMSPSFYDLYRWLEDHLTRE